MKNLGALFIGFIAGLATIFAVRWFIPQKYTFQGVLIDPPAKAMDFSLVDQYGEMFTLSAQHGKINVIFFGYTNCPDICPTTLAMFKNVKAALGDLAAEVNFVMVTVDPERDHPSRLREYLAAFDPSFIGLSGDHHSLTPVWEAYGVYVNHSAGAHADDLLLEHSSRVYLIDQNGQWRLTYPYGMEYEKLVSDIRYLLESNAHQQ